MRTCKQISTIVSHTSLVICFKSKQTSLSASKQSATITQPNFNQAYPAHSNHDFGNIFLNHGYSMIKYCRWGQAIQTQADRTLSPSPAFRRADLRSYCVAWSGNPSSLFATYPVDAIIFWGYVGLWYSKRQLGHTQSNSRISGILHPVIEEPIPYLPPPYRYHTHSSATEHFY